MARSYLWAAALSASLFASSGAHAVRPSVTAGPDVDSHGILRVLCDITGAEIRVAGDTSVAKGDPLEFTLITGSYDVVLFDGYAEIKRPVVVSESEPTEISLTEADMTASELHERGDARYRADRHDEALTFFERAVALAPESIAYRNDYGITLSLLGQLDQAREVLEDAVRICTTSAIAHFNLAGVLVGLNEREAAVWEYQQARKADPNSPAIWNDLAATLLEMGWDGRAEMEYELLVARHPDYANGWYGYAVLLEQRGKAQGAIDAWHAFLAHADATDQSFVEIAESRLAQLERRSSARAE